MIVGYLSCRFAADADHLPLLCNNFYRDHFQFQIDNTQTHRLPNELTSAARNLLNEIEPPPIGLN